MATSNPNPNPNPSSTVILKLLVDTKGHKVLFAESGKDFVDFLFTLLSLPVGTIIRLISKDGMVGSLGKLYESIENLSDTYIQPNFNKDIVLKPKEPVGPNTLGLLTNVESNDGKVFYMCSNSNYNHRYVAHDPNALCPSCNRTISSQMTYVARPTSTAESSGSGGGYVKDVVTYMIMDDLEVKPMSTISSIALLNKFNVKDVGSLEEKVVSLDMNEGVKLLKASLESKSVLTNVFLGKKRASTCPPAYN